MLALWAAFLCNGSSQPADAFLIDIGVPFEDDSNFVLVEHAALLMSTLMPGFGYAQRQPVRRHDRQPGTTPFGSLEWLLSGHSFAQGKLSRASWHGSLLYLFSVGQKYIVRRRIL
jgi:hypothetical protein